MTKKHTLLATAVLTFSLLTGCGTNASLTEFEKNMDTFYTEITAIGKSLEAVNPNSTNAVSEVLGYLQKMEQQFQFLANMEIPKEFFNIEDLADDAAEYMTEALNLYTQVYNSEEFVENVASAAFENYNSAMKRVNYIACLLQGEIPEGASIIEIDNTNSESYPE